MTKLIIGCGYLGLRLAQALARTRPSCRRGETVVRACQPNWPVLESRSFPAMFSTPPAWPNCPQPIQLLMPSLSIAPPARRCAAVYVDGLANVFAMCRTGPFHLCQQQRRLRPDATAHGSTKSSATEPREDSGRIVLDAEKLLRAECPQANILRFAGIYGPADCCGKRRSWPGEPILAAADRWLNLIHVDDGAAPCWPLRQWPNRADYSTSAIAGRRCGVISTVSLPLP